MQKIKRVFRKRRNESEPATSSPRDPVTPRATAPVDDPPHIPPLTNVGTSDTSYTWSSKGTPSNASTGLRHIDSSSHIAAAAAARAATGYSEHVADRNIAERTVTKEESKPVERDASTLAAEERTKRIQANPHSTDDITSDLEQLTFHEPISADNVVGNTVRTTDTTVEERVAPAVTHETIIPTVHHVREEVITREIHTHDVYHYVQPVIDTEVLPAKHYLQDDNGELVEIPADQIPSESRVVETYSQNIEPPRLDSAVSPPQRIIPPRKYPKVGKFAKRADPDMYERFDPRTQYRPPTPPAFPDESPPFPARLYSASPPKQPFLKAEDRSRNSSGSARGGVGWFERGRERTWRPPSVRSSTPSRSSLRSVASRASSVHVRELSDHGIDF